jgi:hypothetical protein
MEPAKDIGHAQVEHEEAPDKPTMQSHMTESRMQAALLRENPRIFRKSFMKLYGCLFVGYLCSATNGFDSNTFGKEASPNLVVTVSLKSMNLTDWLINQVVFLQSPTSPTTLASLPKTKDS